MAPKNPVIAETAPMEEGGSICLNQVSPILSDQEKLEQKQPPVKIIYENVVIYVVLHLLALYGLTRVPSTHLITWVWTFYYYIFTGLGVTAGAHRLWSHRSYKAKTPLRILLALMNSAALQNTLLEWCRNHRIHHKYSETDADPYNAKRGFFFAHMGWLFVTEHLDVTRKSKVLDFSDLYADKVVILQRRYYWWTVLVMCFIVPTVVPWFFWGESLQNAFFMCSILRYLLTFHATSLVNSAAHMWGNRPYDKNINPAENIGVAISTMGEGFHNYHHTFPHDYATSEYGWHLNITTWFIDLMALLGQANDRRKISQNTVDKRRSRTGDGS